MPYVTTNRNQRHQQITFEDLFRGIDPSCLEVSRNTRDTTTYFAKTLLPDTVRKFSYEKMYYSISVFNIKYKHLISEPDKSKFYYSFKIPKRSGGLRQIDAPNAELMSALNDLKKILEQEFFFTYHTSAFAYVNGRSTIDAVKRHQHNNSRWYLKTDLSGFFPHTTPEFLFNMIYQTFPLCEYIKDETYRRAFEEALSLCFLNGGLPQGTPTSPMLTNQMMIPIDFTISKYCREHTPHLMYTRYADDMHISCEFSFGWTEVVNKINDILVSFKAPFEFNKDKIHYGSNAGRNWILGVMLNKDNKITVGHENKKVFKHMLYNFAQSIKENKNCWTLNDVQHLQGLISYYKMVEGDSIDALIQEYSVKSGVEILYNIKKILKGT